MNAKAVQVSIGEELLERIDQDEQAQALGRSAFIRLAVRTYLEARQRRLVDDKIFAAYGAADSPTHEDIEALIERQAWPAR